MYDLQGKFKKYGFKTENYLIQITQDLLCLKLQQWEVDSRHTIALT